MRQSVSDRNPVGKTINNYYCATKMGHRIGAVIVLVVYILGTSSPIASLAAEIPQPQHQNDSITAAAAGENQAMPPVELLMQMSCAGDVEEFLNFIDTSSVDGKDNFVSRSSGLERSLAITPKPATCKTEPVVVPLQPEGASSMALYYPSCTRVNRCGGCCSHALLSCQPTATETLTFQVIKAEWNGAKYVYSNKELVVVEQHVNCTCGCAVKEEHCNAQQKYYPGQCKCVCQNVEERDKCFKESELKLWDEDKCRCTCRKAPDCTTGTYFNENQCQCLKVPYYSSGGSGPQEAAINQAQQQPEDRRKYYLKPIPLPSSDTTKYSTVTN